jgi:hypothetical protein
MTRPDPRHAALTRTAYLIEMAEYEALFEQDEAKRVAPDDRKT